MSNAPAFRDFIAEKIGHRNWYTRSRPAPIRSRGKTYITPAEFASIKAEFEKLFGKPAY